MMTVRDPGIGVEACGHCRAWVVLAVDERGLVRPFDVRPDPDGAFVVGLEVDCLGDPPELVLRAREAVAADACGPRWNPHACAGASV